MPLFSYIALKEKRCIKIKRIFILCLVFCFFALPSCAERKPASCREVLLALIDSEIGLPAGKIYDLNAPEGNSEYIDERVISSLFWEGSAPPMRSGWLDMALFLSTSDHPCELAVFLCDSPDTASDTARILCQRLDVIRTAKAKTEHSAMLDAATVTVIGNYVLLVISSDTDNSIKIARSLIK